MNFILDQHAAGASATWLRRDSAVGEPHYSLRDLAELDGRLEAHLEGLSLAGSDGWDLAVEELKWREPGELFVVAVLAIEDGCPDKLQLALQAVGDSYELRRALISAMGWVRWVLCRPLADLFLDDKDPFWRYVGVAAYDVHRMDPGDRLTTWLADHDDSVIARAAQCVGTLGRHDMSDRLVELIGSDDDAVRFCASWALALRRQDAIAIRVLCDFASGQTGFAEHAASLLTSLLPIDEATSLINELAQGNDRQLRSATIMSGQLGIVDGIPWLLEMMKVPHYARIAGESFSRITGFRLDQRPLEADPPAGFVSGPDDDPNNENVELDPDENLPWPFPDRVAELWQENAERFSLGVRYLLGWEITNLEWMRKILVLGRQRERATAAIELAMSDPRHTLFEVRGSGSRQIASLGCGRLPTEEYRCNRLEAGPDSGGERP